MKSGNLVKWIGLFCVLAASRGHGQEACLDGCKYPDYPGITFTLGEGFLAKGGDVTVTHMGFLRSAYNNDGSVQPVGLPTLIGELYFENPVTGQEVYLFKNQNDGPTHVNDSGKVIDLGNFPKGAPIVFKYKNITGAPNKMFDRYTGPNDGGAYDFNSDPVLKSMFVNGKPKPMSGGSWNWAGVDRFQWAVAGMVPGTDVKQFQFEDLDDRRFNDIVFRVSGVSLTSETFALEPPALTDGHAANGDILVTLANSQAAANQGAKILYTDDGSVPAFDALGNPTGSTKEYTGVIQSGKAVTIKALAWKKSTVNGNGDSTKYAPSPVVSGSYAIARHQWAKPTATPPGGAFTGSVSVALSQSEGAKMYYRLCAVGAVCDAPTAVSTAYPGSPLTLTGLQVLKVIAIQAPNDNSDVAEFVFSPVYKASDAVYLDRNGDGRIETARIAFPDAPTALPASVFLEDPFSPGKKTEVKTADLKWDSATHAVLWADLGATPFAAGTGFRTGPFGAFKPGGDGFDTQAFAIRDGAGPMAVSAEALVSLDSGSVQSLVVRFSEALQDPGRTGALPFRVKRGGEDITGNLQVTGVEILPGNAYRYTFASAVFPLPGDSLKATPLALDGNGNASNMAGWLEVQGKKLSITARIDASGGGCVRGRAITDAKPLAIPLSVIIPRSLSHASGCAEASETIHCLDCLTQEWKRADPRRPDEAGMPVGPEIKVTTQWPFTFDLNFFNTLGEFVNSAKGEVTEEMLRAVTADARGNKIVSLQWYPVSAKGAQVATGAYIVKGMVAVKPDRAKDLLQGVPVDLQPVSRSVLIRFGYVRD
jgi:hypothetical protein